MSSELVKSPMLMLQEQLDKGVSVADLGALMDLAERWQKNQAEKAWNAAMTACQRDMPALVKNKENKFKKIWYTTFDQLDRQIRPIYIREGFSLCFTELESSNPEVCRMALDVLHADGHVRRFEKNVHVDGKGAKGEASMTPTQGDGSTASYARRYVAEMAFNLAREGEDVDGDVMGNTALTTPEVGILKGMIDELVMLRGKAFNIPGFCHWLREGAKTLEEIPRASFAAAVAEINRKRNEKGGK